MALCSLSTGRIGDAAAPRRVDDQLARHDEHFLVGERDRLACLDRGEHRFERRGPGRRTQDDVDVGMRRDGNQTLGPASELRTASAPHAARSRSTASGVAIAAIAGR